MKCVYIQGYVAAAVWMWGRWMNPWPIWFGPERATWHDGYDDALADRAASRLTITATLEPECTRTSAP